MIMQRKRSFDQVQPHTQVNVDRLSALDAGWRAANYLGAAQLYLQDNVLLRRPLRPEDIKPHLKGLWGTQPGLNMVYVHLNRLIQDSDPNILLVVGPGYAAPAILANLFLEGTLCEYAPQLDHDEPGLNELARQFGWPDGVPEYLAPEIPGVIEQGTERGSSLAHAVGAAFDNPDLIVPCVISDDEAETGPLSAAWASNRFLNPVRDGAVLPILHLGGYKAAGPTILGRMDNDELDNLFTGYGYQIGIVAGDDPRKTHEAMWQAMDWALGEIRDLQEQARAGDVPERPVWPMLILRTPTGWTCPREIDGQRLEGTFRSYGLPVPDPRNNPEHLRILEQWLRSYQPENLFDLAGRPVTAVTATCPKGDRRIGRSPHANGGQLRVDLKLPDAARYGIEVPAPGAITASGPALLAEFLRDLLHENEAACNLRFFSPDDTILRRMSPILEATSRVWMWPIIGTDEHLAIDGRILEILSEQTCQGWLEGYLLTGRHGLLVCRETELVIAEPMLEQYGRWLEAARQTPWRKPIASLNCLLIFDAAAADSRGVSLAVSELLAATAPGGSPIRVYMPPDANSLLCVTEQCLRSHNQVNLIFAGSNDQPQWLTPRAARDHCSRGASIWDWAGHNPQQPDVVLAAAGDAPTVEILAAAHLLRRDLPDLRLRVVNVMDLLSLRPPRDDPHGLQDEPFAALFGTQTPVIFAFPGQPQLVHDMLRDRPNPGRFRVYGYLAAGRTTTPFDRLVRSRLSRFDLAIAAIEQAARPDLAAAPLIEKLRARLTRHEQYIRQRGQDLPEISQWRWT